MKSNQPENGNNAEQNQSPIAIVGMACTFPESKDIASYWSNIVKKVDAITDIPATHWKTEDYFNNDPKLSDHTYARKGGFISPVEFDPLEFGITPKAVEATDTSQLLGLVMARQALNDAGYGEGKEFNREKVSVILGITGALELVIPLGARLGHPRWRKALRDSGIDPEKSEEVVKRISDSYVGWQENSFPGLLGNVVAGRIANRLDFGGTNCVVDAACASSLSALHLSCLELNAGRSDMVISGGMDTFNDIFMYMCFSKTPVLSPSGHARPFDHKEDGTVLGEGIGVLILKRLEDAKRDQDKIYALIKGVGSSSDGKGNAIYMPTSSGQARALKDAYKRAGVSPDTIELVEAHGTGTKVGDAAEVNALSAVYGESGRKGSWCALGSVKSQIGHTKAAAGVAGLIKSVMALNNKILPPTIKVDKPIKEVSPGETPFYVNTECRPWIKELESPRRAAVSAFGFGGSNFHCVLEEYKEEKESVLWDPHIEIMAFSASDVRGLTGVLDSFTGLLTWDQVSSKAPEIRRSFDPSANCRIVMVVKKNGKGLSQILKSAIQMLDKSPERREWSTPDNVYFQHGTTAPQSLGIIFPGQGSQYCGMLRDLACSFPQLHNSLEKSNLACKKISGGGAGRVLDSIFPLSMFDEASRQKNEFELRKTEIAQPSIGAVSLGAYKILEYFGVTASSFAGHSFGELTALTASGRVKEDDFFIMSAVRGQLMGSQNGTEGAMLAVRAKIEDVEKIIEEEELSLVIANRNAPTQVVLSGALKEVDRAADLLLKKRVSHIRLPVSGAFHSSLVSGCKDQFYQSIKDVELRDDFKPVYSNTTGELYPEHSDAALKLLSRQLAEPVEFIEMIRNMYRAGTRTFLEVGPASKLSKIVSEVLGDRPATSLSLDASSGRAGGLEDLAVTLARLSVGGHGVDLSQWNSGLPKREETGKKKRVMTIPICGANHFRPESKEEKSGATSANRGVATGSKKTLKERVEKLPSIRGGAEVKKSVRAGGEGARPVENRSGPGSSYLKEALKATGDSMIALQKMQEETAKLHSQFLAGQTRAQEALVSLIDRQRALFANGDTTDISVRNTKEELLPVEPQISGEVVSPVNGDDGDNHQEASLSSGNKGSTEGETDKLVVDTLLEVISEKTGYPIEMLELDMGMDSDLGIDSIKQVEILSALAERLPDSPEVKPDQMGSIRTLKDLAAYLSSAASLEKGPGEKIGSPREVGEYSSPGVVSALMEVVSEKTGYPVEMLELDMGMDSDLGIDSIKQVEILSALAERLPESPEVKPDQMGSLRTLKDLAFYLSSASSERNPDEKSGLPEEVGESSSKGVVSALMEVVSEKTGYPVEMLELDMGMDSDLGIDSIKQVEILSALGEKLPDSPEVKPDQMGTIRTLRDLASFLSMDSSGGGGTRQESTVEHTDLSIVEQALMEVVSEKTGYPVEMLELDMGMDSDLGIDSIKQVEILSALSERLPDSPEVKPDQMGSIRTLRELGAFLSGGGSGEAGESVQGDSSGEADVLNSSPSISTIERSVLLPEPMENSEGREEYSIRGGATFWIVDTGTTLSGRLAKGLEARGYKTLLLKFDELDTLEQPDLLGGLIILSPTGELPPSYYGHILKITKLAASGLRLSAENGGAAYVTVSRLDGSFGLNGLGAAMNPMTGGLSGFSKTVHHEWPEVNARAIDLTLEPTSEESAATLIVDEVFKRGPFEVGISNAGLTSLSLEERALSRSGISGEGVLGRDDVVLITGGGRGVTAEAAVKIAHTYRCRVILVGRTLLRDGDPPWLNGLTEEREIKRAILKNSNGNNPTPRYIENMYRDISSSREIERTLERVKEAGGEAFYITSDVTDESRFSETLSDIQSRFGPVTGVIHGAGILFDRRIEDKSFEQFDTVFRTKVSSLYTIFSSIDLESLKILVCFSSSTGRYGRRGQLDYAVANEILNKFAQKQARLLKKCRVISINWGPWDGGMVTTELKKIFKGEGVGVIGLKEGASYLIDEIESGKGGEIELVVLGKRGVDGEVSSPAGGITKEATEDVMKRAFLYDLDLERFRFLSSHRIDGKPVLPMAMMIEWCAQAALHANPGLHFTGFSKFRLLKGVVIDSNAGYPVEILTGGALRDGNSFLVPVEVRGAGNGKSGAIHARGEFILSAALSPEEIRGRVMDDRGSAYDDSDLYSEHLFHGEAFHSISRVEVCDGESVQALVKSSPSPSEWIKSPERGSWITDPLAIDSAFQIMILWTIDRYNIDSLPCSVERYTQYRSAFPREGVRIRSEITRSNSKTARADISFMDRGNSLIAKIEGYECALSPSLRRAFNKA